VYKKILIFFLLFFIFLLSPININAQTQISFFEDFNGLVLNNEKWESYENGGQINVGSGFIDLRSTPGNNFPYIRSKSDPFPNTGDFSLELRIQFLSIAPWGVGFLAGISTPPNGIPYNDLINSRIFTYHADTSKSVFWFRFFQENIFSSSAPVDLNFHKVRLDYISNQYKYFFDEKEIYSSFSDIRPHAISFGNPHNQKVLNNTTPWSSIKIDYIKITSNTTTIPPLIFIPGHGGSWNTEDIVNNTSVNEWKSTPYFHDQVYGYFLSTLRSSGFNESEGKLYKFYYDWRQKIDNSSDKLDVFVENILKDKPPDTKINIIGHSMGGLVARNYLQRYSGRHGGSPPIEKILTVGSPHEGVVEAYPAWEGAEIWRDDLLQRWSFDLLVKLHQGKYLTRRDTVRNISPSMLDLFPIFDFLKKTNGDIKPINSLSVKNNWLISTKEWLENNINFKDFINTFVGNNYDTSSYLVVKDRDWIDKVLGYWEDGKPIETIKSKEGDGTVLLKSGSINGIVPIKKDFSHSDLVNTEEGIRNIFSQLSLGDPIFSGSPKSISNKFLIFTLHSPCYLRITDSNGKKVGYQVIDNYIQGAQSDENNQFIVIPDPDFFPYKVEVIGKENGKYKLLVGLFTNSDTQYKEFDGMATINSIDLFTLDLNNNQELNSINLSAEYYLINAKNKLQNIINIIDNENFQKAQNILLKTQINSEIQIINNTIKLLKKGDNKKAGTTIETLLPLLFGTRATFQKIIPLSNEKYFLIRSNMFDVTLDLRNGYSLLSINIPQNKAKSQIVSNQKLINIAEKQIILVSKFKEVKEQTISFQSAKEFFSQSSNDFNLGNYQRSYFDGIICKLLLIEASVL